VPVIASDISGNRGLLGNRYPGFFPVGDDKALSRLLERVAHDALWRARLEAAVTARRHLVDPELERTSLAKLIAAMR
jgi:hypothetical protein